MAQTYTTIHYPSPGHTTYTDIVQSAVNVGIMDEYNTARDPYGNEADSLVLIGVFHDGVVLGDTVLAVPDTTRRDTLIVPPKPVPSTCELQQNYPNPFNSATKIPYGVPLAQAIRLTVFNTLGQEIAVLWDGVQTEGYHDAIFEGKGLSSGVYFYRLQSGGLVLTRKLLLLR
jgi:hypothetical protein